MCTFFKTKSIFLHNKPRKAFVFKVPYELKIAVLKGLKEGLK